MLVFFLWFPNRKLFDARFYLRNAVDLKGLWRLFPLLHYLRSGWREGRNPHPLFDSAWYIKTYLHDAPENPLLHYICRGWREGCNPHPLFHTRFFVQRYLKLLRPGQSPLALYLARWQETAGVNALFASACLSKKLACRLVARHDTPLAFYLAHPQDEAFQPFPLFDAGYYAQTNPTAARDWPLLLRHYIEFGAAEGARPNALFDADFYRNTYLSQNASNLDALYHYAEKGRSCGNRPNPFFDANFYMAQVPEEKRAEASEPLVHYLRYGLNKGLYPCPEVAALAKKPRLNILTPLYNTEPNQLWRAVHSVLHQPYPHWRLCLVDDASTAPHIRQMLAEFSALDYRIKVAFLPENSGIATATNRAAELAGQGPDEYLAFLDHDDELAPGALFYAARAINEEHADVLYSDERLVNLESRPLETVFKCALNRELLRTHNHLMHFFIIRQELFSALGGLDKSYDGAQDYDLALKAADSGAKIIHIPRVLYYWRAAATSSSIHHEQKSYAGEAGRRALAASLTRVHLDAAAEKTELRFFYRTRRKLPAGGCVSLCAETFPKPADLSNLERDWPRLEWLLLPGKAGESIPARRNTAARTARGDYLVFLGAGLEKLQQGSLAALLEYGQEPHVAMAAGWLERPASPHCHSGSRPDLKNASPFYYASFLRDASVQHNRFHCAQYAWALAEELCLIKRERFLELGGYDEAYKTLAFAQLDLCFRLHTRGQLLAYTPWAAASLAETKSAALLPAAEADRVLLQARWHTLLASGDPWYNRAILTSAQISTDAFSRWVYGTR